MKIKTKKSYKKPLIVTLSILTVLVGGGFVYAYMAKVGPFNLDDTGNSTLEEEKTTGATIKKNSLEQFVESENQAEKGGSGSDPLPSPTPSNEGGKAAVGMEITALNQQGSILNIRTLIQTVSTTGTCLLRIQSSDGSVYRASADVQALPSSTTCKGFDVPQSDLPAGKLNVTVSFENNILQGSDTKEVTIQ